MNKFLFKSRFVISSLVLLFAILAVCGIMYPVKIFDIQFLPLLQRVLTDFSVIAIVLLCILLGITLLFGRIYCSLFCPFGIIQDIICSIIKKKSEKRANLPIKYFILAVTFGFLIGGSALLVRYIEPYTYFGSAISLSLIGIVAIIFVIVLTIIKKRIFCTDICPVGAILGLMSKISLFKLYVDKANCIHCGMCERTCPSSCIEASSETIENVTCTKCFRCISKCPKNAIKYGIKPKSEIKFNVKRRDFIFTAAAFLALGTMLKAGMEYSKNTVKKVKDIILPPGSIDTKRMFNKCLNCNLCIKNCPNGILTKSDNNFGTVHIDYNKGKGFCDYNCHKCSEVCPSGAIKKISLNEKQKTRIAMAVIESDKCSTCGICKDVCPVGAIIIEEGQKAYIEGFKCIGCGKCKTRCVHGAINVFAVKEQKVL
ncbi:4Fe-4S binding protein [bacterium]|nr:4Fe-4S binding protein [bacterium]